MKRILLSLVFAMPLFANAMSLQINRKQLSAPEKLGALAVIKSQDGFTVLKDNTKQAVHSHDVDPLLRSLSNEQLARALQISRIKVSQLSNNDYKLSLQGGLKGGGIFGANAGFFTGKFLTHLAGHGTILLISACTGPASPAVFAALEATFAAPIEAASNVVGISVGIAGAVATGPV